MDISDIILNKAIKPKAKTELLSKRLLDGSLRTDELTEFASTAKDPVKATCIEALEFATKVNAAVLDKKAFHFVAENLRAKAPRIKWESARVIGNTAHLYKNDLDDAIRNLLENSEHEGTVVRWSAAFALGEILKLKTKYTKILLPAIESIIKREEKNSIKKIYVDAIKKSQK